MSSAPSKEQLSSSKPYLIRALHEWIVDNGLTPYLMVNAEEPGTRVPRQFVKEGQIILNTSPSAVSHLQMTNSFVQFSASFGGTPFEVLMPIASILAIYARENGQGMFFGDDTPGGNGSDDTPPPAEASPAATDKSEADTNKKAPFLKVVK
jgi:stringent starvation protein B